MLNNLSAAKALDALMLELIARGADIPAHVAEDLKAGRALAGMAARQPGNTEIEAKIAPMLERVEMNLLSLAEIQGGAAFAEAWQKRVAAAYLEPAESPPAAPKRAPIVPGDSRWLRIQTSELGDITSAEKPGLTAIAQEDGYTLIYGNEENITALLDNIRQKQGRAGFKRNS